MKMGYIDDSYHINEIATINIVTDWLIDEFDVDTPFTFNNMMMLQVAKNKWNHKKQFLCHKKVGSSSSSHFSFYKFQSIYFHLCMTQNFL